MAKKIPTAPRSYTLRIAPAKGGLPQKELWARLWRTHVSVQKGAKVFGELFLNLRGGLSPELAEEPPITDKQIDKEWSAQRKAWQAEKRKWKKEDAAEGKDGREFDKPEPDRSDAEEILSGQRTNRIRGRRRVLALGWLSVEDDRGAKDHQHRIQEFPVGHRVSMAEAEDKLRQILATKGVGDAKLQEAWWQDCRFALTARIRDDAVWVNRAAAFDATEPRPDTSDSKCLLWSVFGKEFIDLSLESSAEDKSGNEDEDSDELEDGENEKQEKAKDPSNKGRQIFCDLFGTGPKAEFEKTASFARKIRERLGPIYQDEVKDRRERERPKGADAKKKLEAEICLTLKEKLKQVLPDCFDRLPEFPAAELEKAELKEKKPPQTKLLIPETDSRKKPSKFSIRFRLLWMHLGFWRPMPPSVSNGAPDPDKATQLFLKELLDACEEEEEKVFRVLQPAWAAAQLELLKKDSKMKALGAPASEDSGEDGEDDGDESSEEASENGSAGGTSPNEYGYLMAGLAARRVSQTHSWMKLNEAQRHKAAMQQREAEDKLRELDPQRNAQRWLINYESKRGEKSGSESEYRITPRAISAIDEVLSAWSDEATAANREDALEKVQSEAEKFGDPNLFIELANDTERDGVKSSCVWRKGGSGKTSDILKNWVKLRKAQYDQSRLKIPRFCHPDAFFHPAYCELGDSSKPKVHYFWREQKPPKGAGPEEMAEGDHCVWLQLPIDTGEVKYCPMRWQSKRLWRDFGGKTKKHQESKVVEGLPRNDRIGIAAACASADSRNRPALPFSKGSKGWNARLQAGRQELRNLAKKWNEEHGIWKDGGEALEKIKWFLTFSPDLQLADGPWTQYRQKVARNVWDARKKENEKRGQRAKLVLARLPGLRLLSVDLGHRYAAACAVWEALSTEDFKQALQGKKIIAGGCGPNDLYCHVEDPARELKKNTKSSQRKFAVAIYRRTGPDVLPDGKPHPAPWARLERQFLIKLQGEERPARHALGEEIKAVEAFDAAFGRQRRAADKLPHRVDELMSQAVGTARLALRRHGDAARIAFAMTADYKPMTGGKKLRFRLADVPEGVSDELDKTRTQEERDNAQLGSIRDALVLWHDLAVSAKWQDDEALALWNEKILPLIKTAQFTEPPALSADDAGHKKKIEARNKKVGTWRAIWNGLQQNLVRRTPEYEDSEDKSERKARGEAVKALLLEVANQLLSNRRLREEFSTKWKAHWERRDGATAKTDQKGQRVSAGTGWHEHLRKLRNLILPRGIGIGRMVKEIDRDGKQTAVWRRRTNSQKLRRIMRTGGLSLTRIATIKSLYQVMKAFHMRPEPRDPRANVPEKGDGRLTDFARTINDAMEKMREQRVKQLASRIAEAALGIGRMKVSSRGKDQKRPRERVDAPCHAVVIENLSNYRPDELQTRRENRQLMDWSSSKVGKYLAEACQLHGLHLREIAPAYTSRQDSRTGAPGARCADVSAEEFMTAPWWKKEAATARRKEKEKGGGSARGGYLLALEEKLKILPENERKGMRVRIPRNGGEIFVSAHPGPHGARGLQADLNAAANIGLKALLDPDWPGAWWYVPCEHGVPLKDTVKGCPLFTDKGVLPSPLPEVIAADGEESATGGKTGKKGRKQDGAKTTKKINLWRDAGADDFYDPKRQWQPSQQYWRRVEAEVVEGLQQMLAAALSKANASSRPGRPATRMFHFKVDRPVNT